MHTSDLKQAKLFYLINYVLLIKYISCSIRRFRLSSSSPSPFGFYFNCLCYCGCYLHCIIILAFFFSQFQFPTDLKSQCSISLVRDKSARTVPCKWWTCSSAMKNGLFCSKKANRDVEEEQKQLKMCWNGVTEGMRDIHLKF